MKKTYEAIKKYLFKDTRYFFLYLFRYVQDTYQHSCKFYSEKEFLALLLARKSIIRLGDGEIGLLHYLPIHYQKHSNEIRNDFLKIVRSYSDDSPYLVMIPLFVNYTNTALRAIGKITCWMPLKLSYEMFFNKNATYFDQHIFYRDGKYEELVLPYLKNKRIVIVTNDNNKKFLQSTELNQYIYDYIHSPAENAYESKEEIKRDIVKTIEESSYPKEDFVIIMAAGLSKTIIYDLSFKGYQLLDIGKGLESYYKGESIQYQI